MEEPSAELQRRVGQIDQLHATVAVKVPGEQLRRRIEVPRRVKAKRELQMRGKLALAEVLYEPQFVAEEGGYDQIQIAVTVQVADADLPGTDPEHRIRFVVVVWDVEIDVGPAGERRPVVEIDGEKALVLADVLVVGRVPSNCDVLATVTVEVGDRDVGNRGGVDRRPRLGDVQDERTRHVEHARKRARRRNHTRRGPGWRRAGARDERIHRDGQRADTHARAHHDSPRV